MEVSAHLHSKDRQILDHETLPPPNDSYSPPSLLDNQGGVPEAMPNAHHNADPHLQMANQAIGQNSGGVADASVSRVIHHSTELNPELGQDSRPFTNQAAGVGGVSLSSGERANSSGAFGSELPRGHDMDAPPAANPAPVSEESQPLSQEGGDDKVVGGKGGDQLKGVASNASVPLKPPLTKQASQQPPPLARQEPMAVKALKRCNYETYSSDDDDVFLPNPPSKSQADKCIVSMDAGEDSAPSKSTLATAATAVVGNPLPNQTCPVVSPTEKAELETTGEEEGTGSVMVGGGGGGVGLTEDSGEDHGKKEEKEGGDSNMEDGRKEVGAAVGVVRQEDEEDMEQDDNGESKGLV